MAMIEHDRENGPLDADFSELLHGYRTTTFWPLVMRLSGFRTTSMPGSRPETISTVSSSSGGRVSQCRSSSRLPFAREHPICARKGKDSVTRDGDPCRVRVNCDDDFGERAGSQRAVLIRDLAFNDEGSALRVDRGTEADDAAGRSGRPSPARGQSIGWPMRISAAIRSGISARTRTGCWRTMRDNRGIDGKVLAREKRAGG